MVLGINNNVFAMDGNPEFLSCEVGKLSGNTLRERSFATFAQQLVAKKTGGMIVIEGYGDLYVDNLEAKTGLSIHMEKFRQLSAEIPVFQQLTAPAYGRHCFSFKVVMGIGTCSHANINNIYVEYQLSGCEKQINGYWLPEIQPLTTGAYNIWTFSLKYSAPAGCDIRVGRIVTEYLEPGE
jgi:hypothetical protein